MYFHFYLIFPVEQRCKISDTFTNLLLHVNAYNFQTLLLKRLRIESDKESMRILIDYSLMKTFPGLSPHRNRILTR